MIPQPFLHYLSIIHIIPGYCMCYIYHNKKINCSCCQAGLQSGKLKYLKKKKKSHFFSKPWGFIKNCNAKYFWLLLIC